MEQLTNAQNTLLQAIERLKRAPNNPSGMSPTVQELAVELGVKALKSCFASCLAFLVCFFITATPVLAEDTYRVEVTRISNDLYKIDGTDYIIKTRYCYEYRYSDDAILIIESTYGYNIGRLIFIDSKDECDVEKIIQ